MADAASFVPAQDTHSMPLMAHLGELRKRIIFSVLGVIVGFLACWSYADRIFGLVQQPLIRALLHHGLSGGSVYLNPTEPFNLYKPLFGGWVRRRTIHGLSIRALSIVVVHRSQTVSQGKAALCSAGSYLAQLVCSLPEAFWVTRWSTRRRWIS
jgi:Sec-independent protein translocase protein (TatC)